MGAAIPLSIPLWEVGLILFAAMVIVWEATSWLWRAREDDDDQVGFLLSGVLGLLALLLAFAFSLALERHEQRRNLVVAEANALGSFSQRLALLPDAPRDAIGAQLKRYAALRLETARTIEPAAREQVQAAAASRSAALVADTLAAVQPIRETAAAALIVQGLNDVTGFAAERRAAGEARLPLRVLSLIALFCVVTALMLGRALAAGRHRHRFAAWLLFGLLSLACATIVDLDRPRRGAIQVPLQPLESAVAALP